ncbi:MAG: hypothetical protein WCS10_06730 [Bacteroidales bacterium]|nr:hypothetical protein [Bacteroidales bacterium]
MRKLSLLLIASIGLFSILLFTSCNSNKKNAKEEIATYSVDKLLAEAEGLVDKTVIIEGLCTHTCSHGAKKLFLMGSDDTKTIRVEASEEIGSFSKESVNSMVSVKGKVMEERIDEAYLVKWEEGIKAQTAEKHGKEDQGGCTTEKLAQNEAPANTELERIENFRKRITEEKAKSGKAYLSFYFIAAESYEIK